MKPIYEPRGKAKEYGDLALNIYTGCPHRCFYCFAPNVLHKDREQFHSVVEPRPGIVEAVKKQLDRGEITGKLIHLCFTCDPYPTGFDTSVTREIIELLKGAGNHVQILTKGDGRRDFDLVDGDDWYGVTIDGTYELEMYFNKLNALRAAKMRGINTWVSFEPVLDDRNVLEIIALCHKDFDKVKIGKLNYRASKIDWKQFGQDAEALCRRLGLDYYIKDSLRAEMEKV